MQCTISCNDSTIRHLTQLLLVTHYNRVLGVPDAVTIALSAVRNVEIRNVRILDAPQDAIFLKNGGQNVKVSHVTIDGFCGAEHLAIDALYQDVVARGLPIEQWPQFIYERFLPPSAPFPKSEMKGA